MVIGVIADTHGHLPASVHGAMAGVARVIHAGDVGSQSVLDELETIAPVIAVHGNMDVGDLTWRLRDRAVVPLGAHRILVGHNEDDLRAGGVPEGIDVVIVGHTHRARVEREGRVLVVNPGAAGGQSRDGHAPTIALLDLGGDRPQARIVDL